MSFNETHMISLDNYEEWFILYMDNELGAEQKAAVEHFLLLHPHLQEELDLLMGTKLPDEPIIFTAKESLNAAAMKLNVVDESLLLYLDNELTGSEKKAVAQKIATDEAFRLQYEVLLKTKLDAAEAISYPNKKELYRHTEKVIFFPVWMRIAVAIVLILFTALFFLSDSSQQPSAPGYAVNETKPVEKKDLPAPVQAKPEAPLQQTALVQPTPSRVTAKEERTGTQSRSEPVLPQHSLPEQASQAMAALPAVEGHPIEAVTLTERQTAALNNLIAKTPVTSVPLTALNITEDPEEPIVTDGDNKPTRTPAKGFLRKVSRFIERRTGIGTVNADNELIVGAVALKLN